MIKINKISPIDSNSNYKKVSDLEEDFLSKFRKNTKPEDLIKGFIKNNICRSFKNASNIQLDILNYLEIEFPNIIKARPKELEKIIRIFKQNNWQKEIFCNGGKISCGECKSPKKCKGKTTKFGVELLYILGYEERFRGNINRGLWLTKQLNIKVCPYCNAQNTLITEKGYGKEIIKFQLDHFYPKSEFPYLSISLYNLIPSCANCNLTKSSKGLNRITHYNPHDMDLANKSKFNLVYDPSPSKLTVKGIKNQILNIQFKAKYKDPLDIVKNHNEMYHIDGVYNRHKDVAEELLLLKIIYSKMQASMHLKIEGLFSKKIDYYNFLLRNYYLKQDILKRPLSKLTQDIAKQLKILK
jgi:hypothetical protein